MTMRAALRRGVVAVAGWLAARYGMELHYPPRAEPQRAAGTLANDGTPCAPWPDDGERIVRPS